MKRGLALALTCLMVFGASASAEKKKRKVQPIDLAIPLYYQTDYTEPVFTWKEREITVAESGCGATCVSMVIGYFMPQQEPKPDEIMRLAGEMGFYRGDGLGRDALRLLLAEYGIKGRWRELDARAIENVLRAGKPIIEYVGPGYFTNGGHYVVLRGITEEGELLVADPNSEEKTLQKTYRFAAMIQQAGNDYAFLICEPADVREEATEGETKP